MRALLLVTTSLLGAASPAQSAEWTGSTSTDWFDGSNWDDGTSPGEADGAGIFNTTDPNPTVLEGGDASANTIFVGVDGTGQLTVQNGGTLSSTYSVLGSGESAIGTVTINGSSSTLVNSDFLYIGHRGTGTLVIENGGAATNAQSSIGVRAGGEGSVSVADPGSSWTTAGDLVIGDEGSGTLDVHNGGVVGSANGIVGGKADGVGEATITGADSAWETGGDYNSGNFLSVGEAGKGTLTVADGGTVRAVESFIGNLAGSEGVATVTGSGSVWESIRSFSVGEAGTGRLTIENGGTVRSGPLSSVIGREVGAEGIVTVTGAGSTWDNSETYLTIGSSGTGSLIIDDGGSVSDIVGDIAAGDDSKGTVTVRGTGSTWDNSGEIRVGRNGTGSLTIEDGGTVNVGEEIWVAFTPEAVGTVTVTGENSNLTSSGSALVGVEGEGALTIADGGSVNTASGYIGSNAGSVGTATVTGAGSIWTAGALYIGWQGTGALTVADGGEVVVDATNRLSDRIEIGSAGMLNIGAAPGEQAAAPGRVSDSIWFGEGTGALNFNHTATDYVFDPDIAGSGAVNVLAGTTIFNNNKQYTGPTTVYDGGTLIVNGSIGSSSLLTLQPGGKIGGSGTFPSMTLDGSTVSPGNSIGTMTIAGDITFNSGATYDVEVDPESSESDLIEVSGKAILNGGSVVHIGYEGNYRPYSTYTILTADDGVTGTFDGVSSDFAFLDPTLGYSSNDVTLTLQRNDVAFNDIGETGNQVSVASAIEALGASNELYDAVVQLDEAGARTAFELSSGEAHASAKAALIEDSRFVRDVAVARVRAAFAGVAAVSFPVMGYGMTPEREAAPARKDKPAGAFAPAMPGTDRFAVWGHTFGSWGESDGNSNVAGLTRDIGGVVVGADMPVADWRLGLLAGYSHTSFDVDDRSSSGKSDNYHIGLYGGRQRGKLGLRLGASYSWHNIETSRYVGFPGFTDKVEASYDAATAQAFGELGYRMDTSIGSFEPFAGLAYVHLNSDGFTERGGAAALSVSRETTDTTYTTLGLRASHRFSLGSMQATTHGMLAWRHAFGDTTIRSAHAFAGGDSFSVVGVPIAEDAAIIEAGLDLNLSDRAIFGLSYYGQLASDAHDHGFKANLSVKF